MALVTNELNATTIVLQSNVETLEVEINGKQSMVGYHLPGLPRSETPEVDNLCWALRGGLPGSHVWGEGVPYLTSPGGGEVPYHLTYPIMHFVLPRVRIGLEMNLPPPHVDRQTPVKSLPSHNFVCEGVMIMIMAHANILSNI